MLSRRSVLRLLAASAVSPSAFAQNPAILPAKRPGELDIHHIDIGRGNSTLIVAPEGHSFLIDAGSSTSSLETSSPPRPNGSRRPGEWIAEYARRNGISRIDYSLATHIHPDHVGDLEPNCPASSDGSYKLTGLSDVDALLPIETHIDRAYPNFGDARPLDAPFAANYLAYLQSRVRNHKRVEAAKIGSNRQIVLNGTEIRILSANGRIWTGQGETSRSVIPAGRALSAEEQPNENFYSIALRMTFGRFSYYTGGDLYCDTHDGRVPWLDLESPVARLAGKTDVAAANHHGYFDATGSEFVRALDAQAYIIQAWDVGHPGPAQAQRMLGEWPGAAHHDVYATESLPANQLTNNRFVSHFRSRQGHIVVRVSANTETFQIFVLDSTREDAPILFTSQPYRTRS
ncbi:ComEC/Rec2 family competence protein [Terriglobus albidus]|uniref:ComEC/Rec2 family competence protein n=1 Tax=Terriglobus albidus TaxID=1592106 RepID=UPI0021DF783B|nr:MBL fold metallo-hydrolase [Terriglobus albidus]